MWRTILGSGRTHSGDINVHRPALPPFTPSAFYSTPSMPASNLAFRLCFKSGNISVCNGCRNRFDKHAESPYNLCVQHKTIVYITCYALTRVKIWKCILSCTSSMHPAEMEQLSAHWFASTWWTQLSSYHCSQRTLIKSVWTPPENLLVMTKMFFSLSSHGLGARLPIQWTFEDRKYLESQRKIITSYSEKRVTK